MKKENLGKFGSILSGGECRDKANRLLTLEKGIQEVIGLILACRKKGKKVFLIGNGGSASIASHISIDLLKNAHVRALTFNDASLLTCLSNDLGYEQVFAKPIEILADRGDILLAISSSGRSKNILNAVLKARQKGSLVITFSGFSHLNPLRQKGRLNFYVPNQSYGFVEIAHLAIAHSIVDGLMEKTRRG
jgi:D-sedoheptulose 7-phosphate isomerase